MADTTLRCKLRDLISLQDDITHLNENGGNLEALRAKQEHRRVLVDDICGDFEQLSRKHEQELRDRYTTLYQDLTSFMGELSNGHKALTAAGIPETDEEGARLSVCGCVDKG